MDETRNKEAKIICDSLSNYHGPIIIAGDLNDISGSKTLYTLQKILLILIIGACVFMVMPNNVVRAVNVSGAINNIKPSF